MDFNKPFDSTIEGSLIEDPQPAQLNIQIQHDIHSKETEKNLLRMTFQTYFILIAKFVFSSFFPILCSEILLRLFIVCFVCVGLSR
jgi:hypothetical protein